MKISELQEGFFDRFTASGRERNAMQTRISDLQKDLEMGWAGQEPVHKTDPNYNKRAAQMYYLSSALHIPLHDIEKLTAAGGNIFRNAAVEYIRRRLSPPARPDTPPPAPAAAPEPKIPVGKKVPVGGVEYTWSGREWIDTTTGKPATPRIAAAIDAVAGI